MAEIPSIDWVRLDYRRVQHLVTEINALVSSSFFAIQNSQSIFYISSVPFPDKYCVQVVFLFIFNKQISNFQTFFFLL